MRTQLAIPLVAVAALLSACQTTNQGEPDVARITATVQEAATLGTEAALLYHPEWRPAFEVAQVQLVALAAKTNITVSSVLSVLDKLPVKELGSPEAKLGFAGARLLIAGTGWSQDAGLRTKELQPIVLALAEGIKAGTATPQLPKGIAASINRPTPRGYFIPR